MAEAYVTVQVSDQDSGDHTIVLKQGVIGVSTEGAAGIFNVAFDDDLFAEAPVVTVNQAFNGGPASALNPVVTNSGTTGGYPSDNAVIINIQRTYVRIKTGGGETGLYRSFCLIAMGPG